MLFVDNSQYELFQRCPRKWFYRYVKGFELVRDGQRNDPLAIGSLVHDAFEHEFKSKPRRYAYKVPQESINEINPTPDALDLVTLLLNGYKATYPNDPWEVEAVEEPLTLELTPEIIATAKVDTIIRVTERLNFDSNGEIAILEPGLYGFEHKTKGMNIDRVAWKKNWDIATQCDFQMLTMREHFENVRGVFVNVLEKPVIYDPKRKCKGCDARCSFKAYTALPNGQFRCPVCSHEQVFREYKKKKDTEPTPLYWRMLAWRTPDQLKRTKMEIMEVANEMAFLKSENHLPSRRTVECSKTVPMTTCEFEGMCSQMLSPSDFPTVFDVNDNPLHYVFKEKPHDLWKK